MTLKPDFSWEKKLGYPKQCVIGVDEVGRGCLAGPVVAAAVYFPPNIDFTLHTWISEIRDSKKLTPVKRKFLKQKIETLFIGFGVGSCDAQEIDHLNILQASLKAMQKAVRMLRLSLSKDIKKYTIIVDGSITPVSTADEYYVPLIKGDQKSVSVAAASIIAKVVRDEYMENIDSMFPGYGFSVHKGYPTAQHIEQIRMQGYSTLHRKSFHVKQLVL